MSAAEHTVVALGCSTDARYNFLLPLTALFWERVYDHVALLLLVGDEQEWRAHPRLSVALRAFEKFDLLYVFMGRLSGHPDHTLAQNCRQHAAVVSMDSECWVMPADADLWPLRREFYRQHEGSGCKAVLYYGNGDHFQGKETTLSRAAEGLACQTIPTCHVAMRASDWRAIYGLEVDHGKTVGHSVARAVQRTLDGWFGARKETPGYNENMIRWMSDQQIMTEALCQQTWFPSGPPPQEMGAHVSGMVKFVNRRGHPPVDRVDRSVDYTWSLDFDPSKWTDAHLFERPFDDREWSLIRPIVRALLPQHADWAEQYRNEYKEASK